LPEEERPEKEEKEVGVSKLKAGLRQAKRFLAKVSSTLFTSFAFVVWGALSELGRVVRMLERYLEVRVLGGEGWRQGRGRGRKEKVLSSTCVLSFPRVRRAWRLSFLRDMVYSPA